MDKAVYSKAKQSMDNAINDLKKAFSGIRTGRASASLLDGVVVEYYGSSVPINKLANVIIRDARMIEVKPFDKNSAGDIEKAILKSNIGITPVNDGTVIRLEVPPLTEERRLEFTKVIKQMQEDHKVELRNIRRNANEELKVLSNEKKISEDIMHTALDSVQKLSNDFVAEADRLLEMKTKEIMEV